MLISVITPCFNEEENVEACRDEVRRVFRKELPEYEYEHIFTDNSSEDSTVDVLLAMAREDEHVKIIVNALNIGPFRSTFNALKSASGDAVVVQLAADLQDPPAVIVDFVRQWEAGYKVVYGVRNRRREPIWLRAARWLYYRLVCGMADVKTPANSGEYQLVDRWIADGLASVDDHYPYVRGLIARCGQRAIGVNYDWQKRRAGRSKNDLRELLDQAFNGLVSTSNVPMRLSILLGFGSTVLSVVCGLIWLGADLLSLGASPDLTGILALALFFVGGVQLFFIGILGEYIGAIHSQVRRGPAMGEVLRVNFNQSAEVGKE